MLSSHLGLPGAHEAGPRRDCLDVLHLRRDPQHPRRCTPAAGIDDARGLNDRARAQRGPAMCVCDAIDRGEMLFRSRASTRRAGLPLTPVDLPLKLWAPALDHPAAVRANSQPFAEDAAARASRLLRE